MWLSAASVSSCAVMSIVTEACVSCNAKAIFFCSCGVNANETGDWEMESDSVASAGGDDGEIRAWRTAGDAGRVVLQDEIRLMIGDE